MIFTQIQHTLCDFDGYKNHPLSDDELEYFKSVGLEQIWYWYLTTNYEGAGDLIGLKDGKYYHKSLGHCSCYGPTGTGVNLYDDWVPGRGFDSLDDLLANTSPYFRRISLQTLTDFINGTKEGATNE